MYSKEMIENIVYSAINKVTGIECIGENDSLLDKSIGIFPADFIYIFDVIEKKIGKSISNILVNYTYDVFIFNNFVNAIYDVYMNVE